MNGVESIFSAIYGMCSTDHSIRFSLLSCILGSSPVVGYQQNEVPSGYKMITPTFIPVNGGEYAIDQFVVNGVDDAGANIQVMSSTGAWVGWYYWYNEFVDGETTYPAGWFEFGGETPADITLKAGDGVFFNTESTGASVQSAGQVSGDVTIEAPIGYSMLGNATPVEIDIDSMTVAGVEDAGANIQIMDSTGAWVGWYYWYNEFVDGETTYPAGWFEFGGETPAGITLKPGETVFFNTETTGVTVTLPSALK